MTNYEKYKDKIIHLLVGGLGLALHNGEPCRCKSRTCEDCDLEHASDCTQVVTNWLNAEYVEPAPKLAKPEKAFLVALHPRIKYIVRDKDGTLELFQNKPEKRKTFGDWDVNNPSKSLSVSKTQPFFNINFNFIKWEDEKPWSIEELLKLEVIE